MQASARFRCPACGFRVFNRRLSHCERCAQPLPADLAYGPSELALIAAEEQRALQARAVLARQAEQAERERQKRRGDGG